MTSDTLATIMIDGVGGKKFESYNNNNNNELLALWAL